MAAGEGRAPFLAAAVLAGAAAAAACANQQPPPGSPPDTRPPQIERLVPGRDTVVPGFREALKLRFDEPVNLPGDLRRQLRASPAYRYEVSTGFSEVEIEPEDGWRDGVVYCFELPSGISDLLRNRLEEPIGFCFSTGPAISDTRVSGTLLDRMTMSPVSAGRVLFYAAGDTAASDSVPYTAETGTGGEFSRHALPPGPYWAFGFQDRNRNLVLDRHLEPYDSLRFDLGDGATVDSLELAWVEPDSTPPVLGTVEVVDARTLRLLFDDALDPGAEAGAEVTVRDTATGRAWPVTRMRVGEAGELPADTAARPGPADTLAAPGDTLAAPEDTVPGPVPLRAAADTTPPPAGDTVPAAAAAEEPRLPSRAVAVRLGEPLSPGAYRVAARGFENVRGLTGGGDTVFVYTAPTDTAAAAPDTTGVPSDTVGVPSDTTRAPPDAAGTRSDTTGVSPGGARTGRRR